MRDDKATVLLATAPDIRAISSVLRGICLNTSNQRALMTVNDTGLQVNVQEARTILGAFDFSNTKFCSESDLSHRMDWEGSL